MENVNILHQYTKDVEKIIGLEMMAINVSNEGLGSFVKNIAIFFLDKINRIMDLIKVDRIRIRGYEDYNAFVSELYGVRKQINTISKLPGDKYSIVQDILIPNVVGSKVYLFELAREAKDAMKLIEEHTEPILNQLDLFISKVLTEKDTRTSSRPLEPQSGIKELNAKLEKAMKNVINPKNRLDQTKFHKVYPHWASFKETYDELISTSRYGAIENYQVILNLITNISDKVKEFTILAEEKQFEISKHVIKKLGTDLENGAKYITAMSSVMHMYNQACVVLTHAVTALKKKKII